MLDYQRMALEVIAGCATKNQDVPAEQLAGAFVRATADLMRHFGVSEVDDAALREHISPKVHRAYTQWEGIGQGQAN